MAAKQAAKQAAKKPAAKPQAPAQAAKEPGTAVSTRVKHDMTIVKDHMPAHIQADSNRGNENVTAADLVMPRLELVQALSPAVKPNDAGYIEGAKMGMLNNSVTRKLYGKEVYVVPVHYTMQYLVWKKFSEGGGFYGAFNSIEEANARAEAEGGKANHIEVVDTPVHMILIMNTAAGTLEEAMLPLSRTKAKVSRQWNSQIKLIGGDRFSRVFKIASKMEKNKKGQEYANFTVEDIGFTPKTVYAAAEELYNKVKSGAVRTVMDTSHMGVDTDDDAAGDTRM
jgi:hypothetical protein